MNPMTTFALQLRRALRRKEQAEPRPQPQARATAAAEPPSVEIAEDDPFLAFVTAAKGAIDLEGLALESPAVDALRAAGYTLVVPLVSQGELIGMLNLGPRLSEQVYSSEDRKLLDDLAGYAAPAVRVAQLVRQQEAEVRERSRIEQELRVATLIQQQFLPKELPALPGWHVAAYYQPAREVGGDFYDFIELPSGEVAIVVGDVTDKGVPAALIMARTHSILRGDAPRLVSPSDVLARANDLLVREMPSNMFVTCLFAVLDPRTGRLRYANAGHPLPYVRTRDGVIELRATGMPLGLLPGMSYEEQETVLQPGQSMLLHSDGVAEAHRADREMFGFPRLAELVGEAREGQGLIDDVLENLHAFTGPDLEQEDDITLVSIQRAADRPPGGSDGERPGERLLADFTLPSEPGNERRAMEQVVAAVAPLALSGGLLERLKTAVSEGTMNAIEHGNGNDPELLVLVRVLTTPRGLEVRITDRGDGPAAGDPEVPDLDAKLLGLQNPRGWGLFLIKNMVDELHVSGGPGSHTLELVLHMKGGDDDAQDR
jgi:serine phosphatase RsbU (regulator of sigma subunit)/anti-sigma regulatory factor (Ser/Thr protein kinase)